MRRIVLYFVLNQPGLSLATALEVQALAGTLNHSGAGRVAPPVAFRCCTAKRWTCLTQLVLTLHLQLGYTSESDWRQC